ncbi:Mannitol dehydrogenase domain [Bradyrhizobium sp. ORS 375]|uniref:mannitol dehydrogenase family protein n=1 Tax=Bradyrhizobium sp. (strain ORS 375) TaxID=566679 RepID=UPI0002405D6D|nr:mannitol dehydrogenase family protein [Bradyrhizobium sp. ORS 375]CCD91838.1 Mannitol dehydrogenase domain [Bradyrhizobium sp. ORS 375]
MTKAFHRSIFTARLGDLPRPIPRLNLSSARPHTPQVRWPSYDPTRLQPGILHFGCGAFHRAHQNVFTQRAIELEGASASRWGVVGVSFRSRKVRQALAPQDLLYTVMERADDSSRADVVGVLRGLLFAGDQRARIIAMLSDPQIRIVTLTVTPSGYASENAASTDPVGLIVDGLATVRDQRSAPPVLISCDNIPHNGRRLRDALIQRADQRSAALGDWISRNVQCPSSVVDRIVPVPTSADSAAASGLLGLQDLAAVATEPFRQWVIEDFDGPRPQWEQAGALFVPDVTPWELSKLNLLNGTHMAIAFLGMLAGLETVSDVILDPLFRRYAARLMRDEQIPTIPKSDHDLASYSDLLLRRWRNRKIVHQLGRIARNGSEKLQARLLASLASNIATGRPAPCTMLAIAAWACCTAGILRFSGTFVDEAAPGLQRLSVTSGGETSAFVQMLLSREDIFGRELPGNPRFGQELARAIDSLKRFGARGAVSKIVCDAEVHP